MIGMVFGSVDTPFSPWHPAHTCAFASMSSAACAGIAMTAKLTPAPKIVAMKRLDIAPFLPPVTAHGAGEVSKQSPQCATRSGLLAMLLPLSGKVRVDAPGIGLVSPPKRSHHGATVDCR